MSYSQQGLAAFAQTPEYREAQQELGRILSRSATDWEFRQKLLNDPHAALEEAGQTIPRGMDVRFIENQHDATIVLPNVVDEEAELTEKELEAVAGGSTFPCGLLISILITTS